MEYSDGRGNCVNVGHRFSHFSVLHAEIREVRRRLRLNHRHPHLLLRLLLHHLHPLHLQVCGLPAAFPVAKALLNTEAVKRERVAALQAYLRGAVAAVSAAADHSGRPFAAVLPPALAAFLGVVDAAAAERRAHAAVLRRKSSVRERKSMQDAEDRDGIARRETFQSTKL